MPKKPSEGRQNNLVYFLLAAWRCFIIPRFIRRMQRKILLHNWENRSDAEEIRNRVDFYCQIPPNSKLNPDAPRIKDIRLKNTHSKYFFDLMQFLRAYPKNLRLNLLDGDVWENPTFPTITKARRINLPGAENATILKLNYRRHFTRPFDPIPFENKIPKLIFRGETHGKPRREQLLKLWADDPLCDLGDTTKKVISPWHKSPIPLTEHFKYMFVLAVEGNDLATATQWILASNCIPVMTAPSAEGWLMHSQLMPGVHYIQIADDFHDLHSQLQYYISHPDEAKAISEQGKLWARQFQNRKTERIISHLTLQKHLLHTNSTIAKFQNNT